MKPTRSLFAILALTAAVHASASAQVVISQVYGGGAQTGSTYNADFIELYNKGGTAVNLSTYSVQYAAATGTTWTKINLTGTIPANGYFLIRTIATAGAGAALPTPDVTATTPNMSNTAGKVALVSNQTLITGTGCPVGGGFGVVDFVGYGTTANCFEGAGPTGVATSTTTAAIRNNGGCTDNENNALDFATGVPTAHNSSTTTGPCATDADLSVTGLTALPNPAYVGTDTVTYSLSVNNVGASGAANVQVTFPIPAGLTGLSSTPAGSVVGPNYVVSLGTLAALGAQSVQIFATPTGDNTINATFTASTTSSEPNLANNSAGITHTTLLGTASLPVKISQVYPGGGSTNASASFNRDFVELFNAGASAVNLGGRSIQYQSSTGTTWTRLNLNSVTLNPGQYYLIGLGTASTGGAALTGTDQDSTAISMSTTAGKVALVNGPTTLAAGCDPAGALIMDFVAWGATASCAEGGTPAAWTDGDLVRSVYRMADGCTDTNSNSSDLTVGVATPRNSGATVPCGTPRADLALSATSTPGCIVPEGAAALTVQVTLDNLGALTADNTTATINLGGGLAAISAVPSVGSVTVTPASISWNAGSVAPAAAPTLTIVADATAVGVASVSGTGSTTSTEPNLGNNQFAKSLYVPLTRQTHLLEVVATSVASAPAAKRQITPLAGGTANILGVGQVETFSRIYRSPDGTKFAVLIDTDANSFTGDQLVVGTTGPTPTLTAVVDVGTTLIDVTQATTFDRVLAINDAGQVAFSGLRGALGTASDGFVALYTPGSPATVQLLAQEGAAAAGLSDGSTYGTVMRAFGLTNDGKVLMYASLAGGTPSTQNAYLALTDGTTTTVLARKGVDTPVGGGSFLTGAYNAFSTAGIDKSSSITGDGLRTMIGSTLSTGNTARDDSVVIDGTIAIQEGAPITGSSFAENITTISYNYFEPDGHWFAYGTNATTNQDWVVRDGEVIAKVGDPIYAGATEHFSDTTPLNPGVAAFAQCFIQAHGHGSRWIVAGIGDSPDYWNNAVVVSASGEAFREGDPVDLNGNGLDDDNAAVSILRDDRMMVAADGYVYAVVQTRAKDLCGGVVEIGVSLVRAPIPGGPAGCNLADITEIGGTAEAPGNPDNQLTVDDIIVFINLFSDGLGCPGAAPCSRADVTGIGGPPELPDGQLTVDDIIAFFNAFSDGCAV